MEKRANYTSSQTAHPVYRVGLETKRQMGINPVMSVKTGVGAKELLYDMLTINLVERQRISVSFSHYTITLTFVLYFNLHLCAYDSLHLNQLL